MLNVPGWLLLGGLFGWLGSVGLSSNRSRQRNSVAALVGAMLGGLCYHWGDLAAITRPDLMISFSGLFIACLGAVSLLTIANVVWRGRELVPAG